MKKEMRIHAEKEEEKEKLLREIKQLKIKETHLLNQIEFEKNQGWAYYSIFDLVTRLDHKFTKAYKVYTDKVQRLMRTDSSTYIFLFDAICYHKEELMVTLGPATELGQYILKTNPIFSRELDNTQRFKTNAVFNRELDNTQILLSLPELSDILQTAADNLADFYICSYSDDEIFRDVDFGLIEFTIPQDVLKNYFIIIELDSDSDSDSDSDLAK